MIRFFHGIDSILIRVEPSEKRDEVQNSKRGKVLVNCRLQVAKE
jgi:hypothetical protein